MSRRRTLIVLALCVLAGSYLLAGSLPFATTDPPPEDVSTVSQNQLIQPADNGSYLWPYTSRSESIQDRTLAINVIVHAPPEQTRTALTDVSGLQWEETNETQQDADPESYLLSADDGVDWDDAAGSTRYS